MPTFFQATSFINYWLDAVDEHSLHSPFFFDLFKKVIRADNVNQQFDDVERLRQKLLTDTDVITGADPGAGSAVLGDGPRRVKDIAGASLSPARLLRFYHRLIEYYQAKNIVELGTSFGVSTLYLAKANGTEIVTFEGSSPIAEKARKNFAAVQSNNIKLIEGNIDSTLPSYLGLCRKVDVAFMDANHRYEPTMRYFNWLLQKTHARSVIIADDIHSSAEMQKAWKEIKTHRLVYATADLYRCGLIFFDPSLNRQHVVLRH